MRNSAVGEHQLQSNFSTNPEISAGYLNYAVLFAAEESQVVHGRGLCRVMVMVESMSPWERRPMMDSGIFPPQYYGLPFIWRGIIGKERNSGEMSL